MTPDHQPDLPPNPEAVRKKELVLVATGFVDNLAIVTDEIAQASEATKPLARALEQITVGFSNFADPRTVTCQIQLRQTREKDEVRLRDGDDPGIHLRLQNQIDQIAEINIYGGLRAVTSSDFQDGSSSAVRGQGHANRTNTLASSPTVIGVDIYNAGGRRVANVWFQLTPEANAPVAQGITITNLTYTDDDVHLSINQPLAYPQDLAVYLLGNLRTDIRQLQQIRGAAWF